MLGRQERWQEDLFVAGPLSDLIPDDHILKRVDRVLDLSWLRDEVRGLYCEDNGRPSIDPEAAVRLMLAGLYQGITRDRQLMREAQVNLAIRWFAGYRLHEKLPDHSALSKIRRRWGEAVFRSIFDRTVKQCAEAGLVSGETVHVDATLIRADVSWESIVERHVDQVVDENDCNEASGDDARDPEPCSGPSRRRRGAGSRSKRVKKISTTDPDATLSTSSKHSRMEPCYKQHTAVDDRAGVVVDVHVTTGETSEGEALPEQIERVEKRLQGNVETVTADAGYGHASNFAALEERETEAFIPPQSQGKKGRTIPLSQFKYDQRHAIVRCPMGKVLKRSSRTDRGWVHRARPSDCRGCALRARCVPKSMTGRSVLIVDNYPALLRARRRSARRDSRWKMMYDRHRSMVEGVHGESKTLHGLQRAARRSRWNVAIQSYLTAAVINLKRLAKALSPRALVKWLVQAMQTQLHDHHRIIASRPHLHHRKPPVLASTH